MITSKLPVTLFTVGLSAVVLSACSSTYNRTASVPLYQLLTQQDTSLADGAARYALENLKTGNQLGWHNPDSGNSGKVMPTATWFVEERGQYCRSYEEVIRVGKREQRYNDIACRNPQGIWVSASS